MEQKQTAMNELLKWVRTSFPMDLDTTQLIENKIESLLQKEKEQHMETWSDSRIEYRGDGYIGKEKTFEEYYNETYGSNI